MRLFEERDIQRAFECVKAGGQALHLFTWFADPKAPKPFRAGGQFGHLLDQDVGRLMATARRLGVRVIKVAKCGHPWEQHIDLVGRPLARAIGMCNPERSKDDAVFDL
jgi:hypothetical protein